MGKDEPLIIERTANGYQVRPLSGNNVVCVSDIMVFQIMGYVVSPGDGVKTKDTLLGFIVDHFTEGKRE